MDCLQCEVRLWYLTTADSARFFDFASTGDLQKRAIEIIAERFEVDEEKLAENPRLINEVATDSLESLELIMDLEEQLELV